MSEFVEKVEINEEGASKKIEEENFKKLLEFYLGSVLHEDWKKDDKSAYEAASEEKKQKKKIILHTEKKKERLTLEHYLSKNYH